MLTLKDKVKQTILERQSRGFWSRFFDTLLGESTNNLNSIESLIKEGYLPSDEPEINPILKTFIWGGDNAKNDIIENYPEVKWTLVCHRHKFIGQFRPKYFGRAVVNLVNCPFCPDSSAFSIKLDQRDMDSILAHQQDRKSYIASANRYYEGMTEEAREKVTGGGREGKYLFVNTAWKRARHRYADYIHRWTYVNGIAVRVDNSTKGENIYDSISK